MSNSKKDAAAGRPGVAEGTDMPIVSSRNTNLDELIVVGIGASAGGLEALSTMLAHLGDSKRMCYIIAQHLDPKRPSLLLPLLARHTTMDVKEIEDGIEVEGGVVYVAPPNTNVKYSKDQLRLIQPPPAISPKPSVDELFASIAEEKGEFSVGVVLSGTGSDGARGIRTIKAAGGFTIVQNEGTAKFDGMPRSAMATGVVDLSLPPESIGTELDKLVKLPRILPNGDEPMIARDSYNRIVKTLEARKGVSFTDYKEKTISRRIERRMTVNNINKLQDYVEFLQQSPREIDLLFKESLISITSFMRDEEAWDSIREIIQQIISGKQENDPIRVWVPGCATGEELYTLAILFFETLKDDAGKYNLQFYGTDLDEEAIHFARRALYPASSIAALPEHLVNKYFTQAEDAYQVHTYVHEKAIFAKHNVAHDPPFLHLDLISCRNLLTYFKIRLQTSVFSTFHYALEPGGYLFLGKHEATGELADLFSVYNRKHKIFQRRNNRPASQLALERHFGTQSYKLPGVSSRILQRRSLDEMTNDIITQKYDLIAVVVDETYTIRHIKGDASDFLESRPEKTNLNILDLILSDLRDKLRVLLQTAFKEQRDFRQENIRLRTNDLYMVHMEGRPFQHLDDSEQLCAVLFETAPLTPGKKNLKKNASQETLTKIEALEIELDSTRERLQVTVEELETTNGELQSMNEELQSAYEQLETANQELQATNEELITVNEEFHIKASELASVNADLENILNTLDVAIVLVNKEMKLTRYTAAAIEIFDISNSEIGEGISSIGCKIPLPNLGKDISNVIRTGKLISRKVGEAGNTYELKVTPYLSEHRQIAGAMLLFYTQSEAHGHRNMFEIERSR